MKQRYCFCSVADGYYADMLRTTVHSAKQVGVMNEFHFWSDRPVPGASFHPLGIVEKDNYLFKFQIMRDAAKVLPFEYMVWLDADTYFVRHPGDLLNLMQDSPIHAHLESDAAHPDCSREDWWGCPLPAFVELMREQGVKNRSVFNVNAGFCIIHRDVVETFCNLAFFFWQAWKAAGYDGFSEEPPLAYAVQMLCGNPYLHTMERYTDIWGSDWLGCYKDRLPDGRDWMFEDYFRGYRYKVNPAIVHAMRSKKALIQQSHILSKVAGESCT